MITARIGVNQMVPNEIKKQLLNVHETCQYLGIGETKARELIRGRHGFGVKIGNRWYSNKKRLDAWLEKNSM